MCSLEKPDLHLDAHILFPLFFSGSVLPEEEWFADVAHIAIKMLGGKANFGMERDVVSPSAKSISSVLSHGSN